MDMTQLALATVYTGRREVDCAKVALSKRLVHPPPVVRTLRF